MYNLTEYSKNYLKASGTLWNYYKYEPDSGIGGENKNVNYSVKDSKFFDYKTNIAGNLEGIDKTKDVEIAFTLKYSSNFWSTLDMSLIDCEVSLILTWSEQAKQQEMLILMQILQ